MAALRWEGGAVPPRRACERGQSRAPAGALSGASRRRAGSDRAERVGRRPRRARPARAPRLPLQRRDRHLRRPVRAARPRRSRPPAGRDRRPARADRAARARRRHAERADRARRARAASPTRCCRRSASSSRACSTRPISTATWPGSTTATAPSSTGSGSGIVDLLRRRAAERLQSDLDAWHGEPVFAYGFEDLTSAEWSLLEALVGPRRRAGLAAVRARARACSRHCSAPPTISRRSRPGASRSCRRARPSTRIPRSRISSARSSASRRRRRRSSTAPCASSRAPAPRGTLELVGEEMLGAAPRRHARRADRARRAVGRAAGARRSRRCSAGSAFRTRSSRACVSATRRSGTRCCSCCATRGSTAAAASCSRSCARRTRASRARRVDYVEGRLRGRAIHSPARVEEETEKLREAPVPALGELRAAESPVDGVRALIRSMLRSAYGTEAPPAGETSRLDLRTLRRDPAAARRARRADARSASRSRRRTCSRRSSVSRCGSARRSRPAASRCSTCCARARAASRSSSCSGSRRGRCRARSRTSPFLDDDARRELGRRLERPDQVSRDRYLFYTACTRATRRLYLVREAATDDGAPREPSPFWEEVAAVFDDRGRRARDRRAGRSPRSRGRSRRRRPSASGCARSRSSRSPSPTRRARSPTRTTGSAGSRARARRSAARRASRTPRCSRGSARRRRSASPSSSASPTARRRGSSSASSRRRRSTPSVDPMLRGSVAHSALHKFYAGLPKELGHDRVTPENVERAVGFLAPLPRRRAARRRAARADRRCRRPSSTRASGATSRASCATRPRRRSSSLPRRFEVSFGSDRSAPELQRGLPLGDGLLPERQDRPHRRRPVQRARDRAGLQVGTHGRTRRSRSTRS